jgi:hypothetical protein
MTYGRILLMGALAFGVVYYYQSSQAERERLGRQHESDMAQQAQWQHEKELDDAKTERQQAEEQAQQHRAEELAYRVYLSRCGRWPDNDIKLYAIDCR